MTSRKVTISMNPLFSDKLWNYKNFNMVTKLDIAWRMNVHLKL